MTKEAKQFAVDKYGALTGPKKEVIEVMIGDGFEKKEAEEIYAALPAKGTGQPNPPQEQAKQTEGPGNNEQQQAEQNQQQPTEVIKEVHHHHHHEAPQPQQLGRQTTAKGTKGMTADQIKEAQNNHPSMKWYDEFEATISKQEVYNLIADKREAVTTHFTLEKKKHPKFLEPALAANFNSFMDGITFDGKGNFLLPKDKYNPGAIIPYKEWAEMVGRDLKKDRNYQLLKTYVDDAN